MVSFFLVDDDLALDVEVEVTGEFDAGKMGLLRLEL
jgi:hypothetical protein